MADIDFSALVEQGTEDWNRWRTAHPTVQPDLSSAYLFGQALDGFDLSGARLDGACLIGASLHGADLTKASLQRVYASGANFSGANLSRADLSHGNFGGANFSEANLSAVQAKGSNFANAYFEGACLRLWQIDEATALSDLGGSYVYTGSSKQQRQPQKGSFQPGDLAAFVRQLPSSEAAAIAPQKHTLQKRPMLMGLGAAGAIALTALVFTSRSNDATFVSGDRPQSVSAGELDAAACPKNLPELPADSIRYRYQNGAIYYGQLIDGRPSDGRGIMVYASGNRYDGEYQNGQRSGCGTFTFINGRSYVGQFKADQFSGQGIWILENGDRYVGEFKDNHCSGQGTFIFANGFSKSGIWEEGKLLNDTLSCGNQSDLLLSPSADG